MIIAATWIPVFCSSFAIFGLHGFSLLYRCECTNMVDIDIKTNNNKKCEQKTYQKHKQQQKPQFQYQENCNDQRSFVFFFYFKEKQNKKMCLQSGGYMFHIKHHTYECRIGPYIHIIWTNVRTYIATILLYCHTWHL